MFCKSCGSQIDDNALVCPQCGAATPVGAVPPAAPPPPPPPPEQPTYQQPAYQQPTYQQPTYQQPYQQPYQAPASAAVDNPSVGYKFLGFCIPVVGLILYFVWKAEKPLTAKALLKFAIIGFIVSAVLSIVYIIIMAVIGASMDYNYYYHIANFASRFLIR